MKYEIKVKVVKRGIETNNSYIATEVELATRNGLNAIKLMQEGKKRYTWIEIPNDYQMAKYIEKFEIVIAEATTGRRIHTISK